MGAEDITHFPVFAMFVEPITFYFYLHIMIRISVFFTPAYSISNNESGETELSLALQISPYIYDDNLIMDFFHCIIVIEIYKTIEIYQTIAKKNIS